jgi:fatty-acid desaturase
MATVMYLINWKLFLFGWLLPASLTLWCVSISIYAQHWGNKPSNNRYYSWIGFGEGLHANHHISPGIPNSAMNSGEFDYAYMLAKLFAKNKI